MDSTSFTMIRDAVAKVIRDISLKYSQENVMFQTLRDDDACLRIELKYESYLGEVIVEEPSFAPYRYVSLQVLGLRNGIPDLIHYWYDQEGMSVKETIDGLSDALNRALEDNCVD